ncbi:MAG: GC-type dockerin domain-anchored protein [Phycisphaerales bacterium JB040]
MTRTALSLALVGAAATAVVAQPVATFSYLPDGCVSANDMTPDGRFIVGGFDSDADGLADGAYRYDVQLDDLVILGSLGDQTDGVAISDDGSVVTGDMLTPDGEVAGRWTEATGWVSLGFLPNAGSCPSRSNGYDISSDGGTVVGLSWDGCDGRAFIWDGAAGMTQLEVLEDGRNRASVVSADGSVVAGFCQVNTRTPCFWDGLSGAGTVIDPNGAGTEGEVLGMSDDGSVLLLTYYDYANPTKDFYYDAYTWTASGGLQIVGTGSISGGWAGRAMDIAEQTGSIVGFDSLFGNRRAWILLDGQGDCRELIDFVETHGGDVPDGQLLDVPQAITNDGTRIIGHSGGSLAWMITLEYPCAADVNGDGVLDNGDIGAFVALFLASDLAADFNGDGILDNGDIGAFVASFLAGC